MTTHAGEFLLPRTFYARDTVAVARDLLGHRLVRLLNGQRLSGLICETEAYGGADDPASHAYRRTPRSEIMFGPAGLAYVYFVYGMHHCLNTVTAWDGHPGAVLIRSIIPVEGIAIMRERRPGVADRHLADGPGKLCQALDITLVQNKVDITDNIVLFIVAGEPVAEREITVTPRIGVRGDQEALVRPWRFVWKPVEPSPEPGPGNKRSTGSLV
jgi:DNA-3-methyladenine glycosylase